ncbi:MAG: acyl-CoA thioesterase-2 [Candidatus Azotimanducaceae bacterium]|jgi:acyl-CoA thioesterase-2
MKDPTKIDVAAELLDILELETIDSNLYRGRNDSVHRQRLFGGQVLAQAVAAAINTVDEDRPCHSAHGYFLRPGSPEMPVLYRVERIRDGRSFTTRRIVALQKGEAIFSMDASFQVIEAGLSHQMPMQNVPTPDDLEDDVVIATRNGVTHPWLLRERPFEMRSTAQLAEPEKNRFENPVWIKFRTPLSQPENKPDKEPVTEPVTEPVKDAQRYHQELLAYASDMGFVSTSFLPHQEQQSRNDIQMASLDHALWFHQEVNVTEWLLYIKETNNAEGARGFNRGAFYSMDGTLVASTMQEGLLRVRN